MTGHRTVGSSVDVDPGQGCWNHRSEPTKETCSNCGRNACQHCYIDAPAGPTCINCALRIAGVRVTRRS